MPGISFLARLGHLIIKHGDDYGFGKVATTHICQNHSEPLVGLKLRLCKKTIVKNMTNMRCGQVAATTTLVTVV